MTIWKIRCINDFFSYEKNKFYIQILKNIDKHNFLGQFWVSYNIRHEENGCPLSELTILTRFDKIDSSAYVIKFLLRLDHFQINNMTSK